MPRQKLSEYRSKILVSEALGVPYRGWSIDFKQPLDSQLEAINSEASYVVKVDQGIKGRFKKGLVVLNVQKNDIESTLNELHSKGYESFIVEPQATYESAEERYLAISYDKTGSRISYSNLGGVDIESNVDSIKHVDITETTDWATVSNETNLSADQLKNLNNIFDENYMTMLEVNPYIVKDGSTLPLDAAIEVDDAAGYFVNTWGHNDFRRSSAKQLSAEEKTVQELDENSPASLKLEVLNPDGSVFLLLSGGGASVVVADEIYNLGFGKELANYGEYSGNPNTEETYLYTKCLLSLLIKSKSPHKVLFIGGAVANFTDIANTFSGIIKAIDEMHTELNAQDVKVFVRRGGPRQEIGLKKIKETLDKYGLLGSVHDPSTALTEVVGEAMRAVS